MIKKYITVEELKKHNKQDDLWISIQGKCYNVTIGWKNIDVAIFRFIVWLDKKLLMHSLLLSKSNWIFGFGNRIQLYINDHFVFWNFIDVGTAWKYFDKFFTGYHLKDYDVTKVSKDYRKHCYEFSKADMFGKKKGMEWFIRSALWHC